MKIQQLREYSKEAKENFLLEKRKERQQSLIEKPIWGALVDPNDPTKGKNYPLHDHQKLVYESDRRYTAAVAGTGGGKTAVGALWALRQISRTLQRTQENVGKPFCLGFIVAPTYKVLSRATVPMFLDVISGTALGPEAGGRYLESKSYYELPNEWGRIWCQGADNPYGLEGGQFDFVWIDEGGQLQKKAFNALQGRTGQKQAPILVTTTPYITNEGFGPLHNEWMPQFKAGNPDYLIEQFPSVANPAYPIEEFLRQKATLPPEVFQARYQGLFTAIEGQVYPRFQHIVKNLSSDELLRVLEKCYKFVGGLDFGWNDPFCALLGGVCDYPYPETLWIFYERYKSMTTLDTHAEALPKEIFGKKPTWYADHNPEAIHKLRKGGHNVKRAPKFAKGAASSAILNGILSVNRRIYTESIVVLGNRCRATVAESTTYIYPEKNEEIIGDKPLDKDNHAMDALRYLVTGLDKKKAV